jgi:hypothetical protein
MPIRKLCIVAYRKGEGEEKIIELKSLRRLMQLYGLMMYGPPILIQRDNSYLSNEKTEADSAKSPKSTKCGPMY